jgi:hypothetical protein
VHKVSRIGKFSATVLNKENRTPQISFPMPCNRLVNGHQG